MASGALQKVRLSYPEVDQLLKLARDRTVIRQSACVRAATVLTHAHLESYLEGIVLESIDGLNKLAPARKKWPADIATAIWGRRLFPEAESFSEAKAEKDLKRRVRRLVKGVQQVDRVARQVPVQAEDILRSNKYPKQSNIEAVCGRLGYHNPIVRISHRRGRPYEVWIQTLNQNRAAIAHGDTMAPYLTDVFVTIHGVREFIKVLDDELSQHLSAFLGRRPW